MTWAIRGVIEGFYGTPWSWDQRRTVMRWCHDRGMTHYVYAPKDDPLHRERWREPYPDDQLACFEKLVAEDTLDVGFAISPGLSIDYGSPDDRAALATKIDAVIERGVRSIWLALDDIPPRPGLGDDHAAITTWLADRLPDGVQLVLVPTEYTGTRSTPYLDALANDVPESVPIAWTGRTVVCDTITSDEAAARAHALGGRPPLVWDNYPVNDAIMADRLFLAPIAGRDPDLADHCSGYVSNAMVQPNASLLPLASVAGYLSGHDPHAVWRDEADALGLRAFAEACDGRRPRELVRDVVRSTGEARAAAIDALSSWLDEAATTEVADGALAAETQPWRAQLADEVGLCQTALRVLRRIDAGQLGRATEEALGLAYLWPMVRRATPSVMGPRCSFRPVISQGDDGGWRYRTGSLDEDASATDALVRHALQQLADATEASA